MTTTDVFAIPWINGVFWVLKINDESVEMWNVLISQFFLVYVAKSCNSPLSSSTSNFHCNLYQHNKTWLYGWWLCFLEVLLLLLFLSYPGVVSLTSLWIENFPFLNSFHFVMSSCATFFFGRKILKIFVVYFLMMAAILCHNKICLETVIYVIRRH